MCSWWQWIRDRGDVGSGGVQEEAEDVIPYLTEGWGLGGCQTVSGLDSGVFAKNQWDLVNYGNGDC